LVALLGCGGGELDGSDARLALRARFATRIDATGFPCGAFPTPRAGFGEQLPPAAETVQIAIEGVCCVKLSRDVVHETERFLLDGIEPGRVDVVVRAFPGTLAPGFSLPCDVSGVDERGDRTAGLGDPCDANVADQPAFPSYELATEVAVAARGITLVDLGVVPAIPFFIVAEEMAEESELPRPWPGRSSASRIVAVTAAIAVGDLADSSVLLLRKDGLDIVLEAGANFGEVRSPCDDCGEQFFCGPGALEASGFFFAAMIADDVPVGRAQIVFRETDDGDELSYEFDILPLPTPTSIPTATDTPTATELPTVTETPTPRVTDTPTPRETDTPTPRETDTPTPRETDTPTPEATDTPPTFVIP
jgi:hypothetical protein